MKGMQRGFLFCFSMALAIGLATSVGQAFTIDSFATANTPYNVDVGVGQPGPTSGSASAGGIWNGVRAVTVARTAGTGLLRNTDVDVAEINAFTGYGTGVGTAVLTYDGNSDALFNPVGIDEDWSTLNYIHLFADSAYLANPNISVAVYSVGGGSSTRSLAPAVGGEDLYFRFSQFSGTVDWQHVSGLQLTMRSGGNQAVTLTGPITADVPEPGTFALMGVLLSMGGAAFRRMKAGQKTAEQAA